MNAEYPRCPSCGSDELDTAGEAARSFRCGTYLTPIGGFRSQECRDACGLEPYLPEIVRIIDGAVKGDRAKVDGYARQLAQKLRQSGHRASAVRIEKTIDNAATSEVATQ